MTVPSWRPLLAVVALLCTLVTPASAATTPRAIYFVGDSITAGAGIDPALINRDSYPWRTAHLLCGQECTDVHVVGHSGQCLVYAGCAYQPTLLQTIETEVLDATPTPTEVVILIGRNDLWHVDDATLQAAFFQLWLKVHSRGVHFHVGTILPATATYPQYPLTEPQQRRINTWMRPFFGDQIVDFDAAMRDSNGNLPALYSNDGIHPDKWGGVVMADTAIAAGVGTF